jgi:hypothetical protein
MNQYAKAAALTFRIIGMLLIIVGLIFVVIYTVQAILFSMMLAPIFYLQAAIYCGSFLILGGLLIGFAKTLGRIASKDLE